MKTEAYYKRLARGYGSWQGIKQRCLVSTTVNYPNYGARGITVCIALANSFDYFVSVIGEKPSLKHSVDRIDNSKSYTCGKCDDCLSNNWLLNIRWATDSEQMLNRGKDGHIFRAKGLTYRTKNYANKGISKTRYGKYRVRVWQSGKYRSLGAYTTIQDARIVRDHYVALLKSA